MPPSRHALPVFVLLLLPSGGSAQPSAAAISCGRTVTGTTVGGAHVVGNAANDALFTFALAGRTTVAFNGCQSEYDSYLRVYEGGAGDLQTAPLVSSSDDGCPSGQGHRYATLLAAQAYPAGNYTLVVEGYRSDAGTFSVQMQCATATDEPTSASPTDSGETFAPTARPSSPTIAPTDPGETFAPTARPSSPPTLTPTVPPTQPYCAMSSPTSSPTAVPTPAPVSTPAPTSAAPTAVCPETTEENRTSCGPGSIFHCGRCRTLRYPIGNASVLNRASMGAAQAQLEMLQLYLGEGAIPAPGANGTGINSTAFIDAQFRFRNASFQARVAAGTFSLAGAAVAIHNYTHLIATDPSLSNFSGRPNLPLTSIWDCAYYVDEQTCITVRRIAVVNGTIFRRFEVHYAGELRLFYAITALLVVRARPNGLIAAVCGISLNWPCLCIGQLFGSM